ncbi:MAG: hypothetical protein LWX83_07675 [Anaerolineae bacterium]|nr:hypothetical protein [Anaerolineae bacterium]
MHKLDQLLLEIRNESSPSFLSTSIIGMDGLPIAGASVDDSDSRGDRSARAAMIMRLASNISGKLNLGDVEEELITTNHSYILLRFLGDGSYIWGLTVSRDAILGSARLTMNEYASQLWDAIPR